ncbi:xylulokinase [Rhodovulum iodosum]|uniref:Xylulose kinase n=1 Tax=Rhodovulum iodosum TaxID=68291 RepID=A0ABV3XRD6_9RHOB|nr:xylulokinase [Rhodovulum robiginosum]RSK31363.1 xylulokinase [Rhodovulum robiginosum]
MFLGLDLGTSGLRASLVDEAGRIVDTTEASYPVAHPHSGWSEQDPADWIAACQGTMAALRRTQPKAFAALRGIGLSGQMHGATLLGADDKVLRPCILWNDTRAHDEAAALDALPDVRRLSGNIVFPGFTAPKLLWVAAHEPDVFSAVAKVLLPKDYLRLWLTGTHVSEMSDAAGTSWMDTGARAWSGTLLEAGQMRAEQMPDLVEGSAVSGRLRADLAAELGLAGSVAVAGGGGDNAAAACGVGALAEGAGFVSLGTSGVLLAARDRYAPAPETALHTFCHAVPETWYQMGVILAATDSLNWHARITGHKPAALSAELGTAIGAPGSLRFLPYLSGERTPHNDSAIRGAFAGLDIATERADMTRAVMEGVAFALTDSLEALKATGARLDRLLAIGGGSKSPYWVELLATVFGLPIDLPAQGDYGAALGAARLAMVAVTGAKPAEVMTPPPVARTVAPRADLTPAYREAYQGFRALYPALKAVT